MGEGSAVRGGSEKFFLGGEWFFGPLGGEKVRPEGGGTRGEIFLLAAFGGQKNPDFVKKLQNFSFFLDFCKIFGRLRRPGGEQ